MIERYKQLFDYDMHSGILTHRPRPRSDFSSESLFKRFNTMFCGKAAGSEFEFRSGNKYICVSVDGRSVRAHRVAWAIFHGFEPDIIDHINGDGCDNRIENLRDAGYKLNNRNKRLCKNNKSGLSGVCWDKDKRKWAAKVGKEKLGKFNNIFDAACARISRQNELGYISRA